MKNTHKPMWLACLLSQTVWLGSLLVLLLISCTVLVGTADPVSMIRPLSAACLYLAVLFSGIAAARFSGDGLLSGILSGIVTALLMPALSCLPLPEYGFAFPYNLIFTAAAIPFSCAGAVIGRKRNHRKSPARKKSGRKR